MLIFEIGVVANLLEDGLLALRASQVRREKSIEFVFKTVSEGEGVPAEFAEQHAQGHYDGRGGPRILVESDNHE